MGVYLKTPPDPDTGNSRIHYVNDDDVNIGKPGFEIVTAEDYEPQRVEEAEALRLAQLDTQRGASEDEKDARIAELEAQLEALGAATAKPALKSPTGS